MWRIWRVPCPAEMRNSIYGKDLNSGPSFQGDKSELQLFSPQALSLCRKWRGMGNRAWYRFWHLNGRVYGFTGREYETNTGLYYYRARYYNPAIGRFLQLDPIGYYDSLNLYQYCGNNPVNWIDPSGLWTEEGHRNLGTIGGGGEKDKFDYAALDERHPAHESWRSNRRHFRDLADAYRDARRAAEEHDKTAFEEHMHEMQVWYAHRGRGWNGWHPLGYPDDPNHSDNKKRYDRADRMTERMEEYWRKHNP